MDTGKKQDTSTGNSSTISPIQTLAKESVSEKEAKSSVVVQMKPVNNNSCKTLADILSLLQEDLSQYQKTLAKTLPKGSVSVQMQFTDKGGIIYIPPIDGHTFRMEDGHILIDDIPVTGWKPTDTGNTGKP